MNKLYISLFTLLLFSSFIWAQRPNSQQRPKVQVTGKVIDKDSQQALEYATLIFTPAKGKRVTGGITDSKGFFNIEIPVGMYKIAVEFLSFKTKTLPQQKITKNTDLGTISLEVDMEAIDEVEIIAEKSTVEIRLDKKIYNVGKDMTVKGGTASDVLENVPSVTVDVEGNVSLRGNESVRILIDGKPSGLVGLNSTDALRQLPAEAIKKVEVITSPSARYDAEGTAGILNIILRRSKMQGFNASTTLTTGYPHNHGISANVNYRAKKFNVFTNLGYNYRNSPGNAYFEKIDDETDKTIDKEIREYNRIRNRFNANVGMEYYLTKNASITGGFVYRNSPSERTLDNFGFEYDYPNDIVIEETYRNEIENEDDQVLEYNFNYTQKFKTDGHQLTFDAKYQDNYELEVSDIVDKTVYPTGIADLLEKVDNLENQDRWLFKSDYVLPFGENQQFEAGFQSSLLNNNIDYQVQIFNNESQEFEVDNYISDIFDYKENIHAVYTQYGNKYGNLSTLLGLRMEFTDIDVKLKNNTSVDFDKQYTKFFPTLNLAYEIKEGENFTLGFNRRIRRPRSRHFTPFQSRSSTNIVFQGNPDLDPVFTYTSELGYLKKWKSIMLNTSIYYKHSENSFEFVEYEENDRLVRTPINLEDQDRIGFEFSTSYTPKRGIRLSNNFNFFHYKTTGFYNGKDYGTEDLSWFNRFSSQIRILKKTDLQATAFYHGPRNTAYSSRKGILMANLSLSRDVLKDKATFVFSVRDLFNTRKRVMETYYENFTNYSEFQWRERQFTLSFTYRFNQKKKRNRQRGDFNGDDDFEGGK